MQFKQLHELQIVSKYFLNASLYHMNIYEDILVSGLHNGMSQKYVCL